MANRTAKNCLYFLVGFTILLFAGKLFAGDQNLVASEVYYNVKTKTKVAVLVESSDMSGQQSFVIYIDGNKDVGFESSFFVSVYAENLDPVVKKYINKKINPEWKNLFTPSLIVLN